MGRVRHDDINGQQNPVSPFVVKKYISFFACGDLEACFAFAGTWRPFQVLNLDLLVRCLGYQKSRMRRLDRPFTGVPTVAFGCQMIGQTEPAALLILSEFRETFK